MDNHRLGRDLLSDLPVGIIKIILTHLPIRDAIRTTILSTKWMNRWVSIPQLVFEENDIIVSSVEESIREDRLKTFVTWTLFHHEGPIDKFKLDAYHICRCTKTDQWLLLLSRKDIKELTLRLGMSILSLTEEFVVPSSLYYFRNLTFLELDGCQFGPPPPTFKGFLCLRTLILEFVDVPSETIESLVANSPLLENLELADVGDSKLIISAPYLKYFSLYCSTGVPELYLSTPLLAKMSVDLDWVDLEPEEQRPTVCNFLGGFTNLESLAGDSYFTKYLSMDIEYCQHPLAFPRLKIITLVGVNYEDMDEILVVIRLIMDSPNLCELQVQMYSDEVDLSTVPGVHFWDSKCPKSCTFKNLKVIKVSDFCGALYEMKFIKFLLESSPVLETMIVEPTHHLTMQQIQTAIVKLLSYRRASTNAQILFNLNQG